MLCIKVKIPCNRSPGYSELVRIYYKFDENGNFHFIAYNGCDVMSPCAQCEKCFKEVFSIAQTAHTLSDLLSEYPSAN